MTCMALSDLTESISKVKFITDRQTDRSNLTESISKVEFISVESYTCFTDRQTDRQLMKLKPCL